jgi:hypothetical protein
MTGTALLAIAVLGYLMYSAGAEPADPRDKYQAWYIGAAVLLSGVLIVLFGNPTRAPPQASAIEDGIVS